jgi:molecular chaperone GrpE
MDMTYRQLMATLEKNGVRQLNPVGEKLNPSAHQAVSTAESAEVPPNHVLSVMQRGYQLHDRVIRPAMVVVARAPAAAPEPPAS